MERMEPNALTKTTRMNMLLDFYEELLTEKQQTILSYYYRDDFSLGEIASEFGISRQAVYDNIKRAQQALEHYEQKLELLARYERTVHLTEKLEASLATLMIEQQQRNELTNIIEQLRLIDISAGMEAIKDGSI